MPLEYDDILGSWGVYSKDWPALHCKNKEEADRAFVACTKEHVVPYGSYVQCGLTLRVKIPEYLQKLKAHLEASPLKTATEVIAKYKNR